MCESPCIYRGMRAFVGFDVRIIRIPVSSCAASEWSVQQSRKSFARQRHAASQALSANSNWNPYKFEPRPFHYPSEFGAQIHRRALIARNDVIRDRFARRITRLYCGIIERLGFASRYRRSRYNQMPMHVLKNTAITCKSDGIETTPEGRLNRKLFPNRLSDFTDPPCKSTNVN